MSNFYGISLVVIVLIANSIIQSQTYIAVVDFSGKGVSDTEASALTDRLRTELVRLEKFKVIEREMVEEILNEQGIQQTGCISDECIVEVGKLIGVKQIIGGSISKVGNVFSVSSRIISVETGEVLHVSTYDYKGEIGNLLIKGMKEVALQLASIQTIKPSRISGEGALYITSVPSGGMILINDVKEEGVTPLFVERKAVGEYEIYVEKGDYSAVTTVQLQADDMKKVILVLKLGKGNLKVITTPFEARISLDGIFKGQTPIIVKDLKAGWHELKISKDGYSTVNKRVEIKNNKTEEIQLTLLELGTLFIESNPSGASVFINGKSIGITPLNTKLDSGNYAVKLKKQYYYDNDFSINLTAGEKKDVRIELKASSGNFMITSSPSSVEVLIDGIKRGLTPLNIKIDEGSHKIVMRKKDHYENEITIQLAAVEKKNINVDLKRHVGSLNITSNPSSAKVMLDGNQIGKTPLEISDVITGIYSVEFQKEGYFPQKESVNIKVDAISRLKSDLVSITSINEKIKNLQTKEYCWLGAAGISTIIAGYFKYSSVKHYDEYLITTDKATDLHKTIEREDKIYPVAFGIGLGCLVPAIYYYFEVEGLNNKWDLSVIPQRSGISIAVGMELQ